MAAPYSTLRSKHNRAVAAWLVSQGVAALPSNTGASTGYPNCVVKTVRGIPDPPLTGNYRLTSYVTFKGSAAGGDGTDSKRALFDQLVAKGQDALMQSDSAGYGLRLTAAGITASGRALAVSDPANNADMVDYTCLEWDDGGFGDGEPDDKGCDWVEISIFNALACSKNVD